VSRVPALIRRVSALAACRRRAGPRGGVCDLRRNGTGSCAKRRDRQTQEVCSAEFGVVAGEVFAVEYARAPLASLIANRTPTSCRGQLMMRAVIADSVLWLSNVIRMPIP
jgi:hypothetical protein